MVKMCDGILVLVSLGALTLLVVKDTASQFLRSVTLLRGRIRDLFQSGQTLGRLADEARTYFSSSRTLWPTAPVPVR